MRACSFVPKNDELAAILAFDFEMGFRAPVWVRDKLPVMKRRQSRKLSFSGLAGIALEMVTFNKPAGASKPTLR